VPEPHELSEFSPILKNVYLPIRKNAWPKMSVLAAQAKKIGPEHAKFAGNDLFFDVKVGRRGGFVSSVSGFAPESLVAREKQGRLGIARSYAKLFVDGLALKATADPKGTYISAAKKIMEDVMDQWTVEQNRVMHGDGLGIRAVVVARTSATVVTCNAPYGISSAGPGNLHLTEGDTVASHDVSASNAMLGKAKISSITLSGDTATITFASSIEGAGTIAVGDLLVTAVPTAVSASDSSYGAEPYGLKAFVDVEASFNTFEGINDARWVAQKLTSATVDETVVMRLLNTIRSRAGIEWRTNPKAMLLLTTTGIWQQYGESLLGLRRFSAPEMKLNGGFTGVACAGGVLVDDPWAPRGRLYAIHGPDTILVDLMDFAKLSYEDSPDWQRSSTRDGYEALMGTYWNYGLTQRNSQGVISSITDSTNFSPVY
jgi:hypothetical protein